MVGVLLGSFVGGLVSDKFGRAFTSHVMLTLIGPLSILAGITQGFIMYAVVHTIILVATSAIWISCISHMVELSSKKVPKRRDAADMVTLTSIVQL